MKYTLCAATVVVAGQLSIAGAQTETTEQAGMSPETATVADQDRVLDRVTVTAQQREQDLQDVPIAVSAIGSEQIEDLAIRTVTDLQVSVPSLNVFEANRPSTSTSFRLRGIGTAGSDGGLEGAVGLFVDGVYRSRSGMGLGDLVDIDRVEVLRGPQGTLFGRNTSAGSISVFTKNPTNEYEGMAEVTVGNYDMRRVSGVLNVPVVEDVFAVRLTGNYHERDGFIEDTRRDESYNNRDRWSLSGKALFTPTETFDFLLKVDYAKVDESCCQSIRFSNSDSPLFPILAGLAEANGSDYPLNPTPSQLRTSVNGDVVNQLDDFGVSGEVNWTIGDIELTSITSFRSFDSLADNDVDFSGTDLLGQRVDFEVDNFSQEFRLNGTLDEVAQGLDWLVGAYYSDEDIIFMESIRQGVDLEPYFGVLLGNASLGALYAPMGDAFGNRAEQSGEAFALFTHNILSLTDRLELVAGLRYTDEEKAARSDPFWNNGVANLPFSGLGLPLSPHNAYDTEFSDDALTINLSASYHWTDDIMTYASYSQGFKSGGISLARESAGLVYSTNTACTADGTVAVPAGGGLPTIYACDPLNPTFESETVDAYEIGLRSVFHDGAVLLNLTGFYADYEDLQINTFNGFSFALQNAGSATTEGVELETQWLTPIDGVTLGGNLSYTNARFGDEIPAILAGEPPVGGQRLDLAPEWSGAITADYNRRVLNDGAEFFARGSFAFNSSQFTATRLDSQGDAFKLPSRELVDLSAGLAFDGGLEISAFCRNCTDERYFYLVFNSVAQPGGKDGYPGNPREYGVRLKKSF